mgnify:FL=1
MVKFAIIGLGYISQRHLDAIHNNGGKLIMACDIDKEKKQKVADDVLFFTDYKDMIKNPLFDKVDWVSICTPNYLHFQMINDCFKNGKNILSEKPLVIDSQDLKDLEYIQNLAKDRKIYTVLQLRHNPEVEIFKDKFREGKYEGRMDIHLHRGEFYFEGWKGNENRSGGLLFNIGIHYFDLLLYLFGKPTNWGIGNKEKNYADGRLVFNNVSIDWSLSIKAPMDNQIRKLKVGNEVLDLTRNFENLHNKVYEKVLNLEGFEIEEVGQVTKLLEEMKNA